MKSFFIYNDCCFYFSSFISNIQLLQKSFVPLHLSIYAISTHEMYSNLHFITTSLQNVTSI